MGCCWLGRVDRVALIILLLRILGQRVGEKLDMLR